MLEKTKNQSPKTNTSKELDIICLIKLQQQLEAASILLDKIFNKLCLDFETMEKVTKSIPSRDSNIWDFKAAKESLDILIAIAALGSPQIIKNNGWVVEVVSKLENIRNKKEE